MTETITASPLTWPHHQQPRTKSHNRTHGRFSRRSDRGYGNDQLTLRQATLRVVDEISKFTKAGQGWRCDSDDIIISTNLALRNDGFPRSGQRKPDDPGVAVWFVLDNKQRCVPCDQYLRIEDNIAGSAATISALRMIERHGSGMFEAAFTGFTALPGPGMSIARSWRDELDYWGSNYDEARLAYRRARKLAHTDHGGNVDRFDCVNDAWKQAQQELSDD